MRTVNQSASFAFASKIAVVNSVVVGLGALRRLDLKRISLQAWRGTIWTTTPTTDTGTPGISDGGSSFTTKPSRQLKSLCSPSCSQPPRGRLYDRHGLEHAFLAMHAAAYLMVAAAPVIAG